MLFKQLFLHILVTQLKKKKKKDNQEHDITDPFLALEIALARLNENTHHSQNTPPQNHEQPDVINNNNPLDA